MSDCPTDCPVVRHGATVGLRCPHGDGLHRHEGRVHHKNTTSPHALPSLAILNVVAQLHILPLVRQGAGF